MLTAFPVVSGSVLPNKIAQGMIQLSMRRARVSTKPGVYVGRTASIPDWIIMLSITEVALLYHNICSAA